MDIRNDLDALKRAGWIVEKHTHIINQQADGSKWVSIFIRRTEKE